MNKEFVLVVWCKTSSNIHSKKIYTQRRSVSCMSSVYLQGVLTLHISMVQATWPAARPSKSTKVLSSPVTKSHGTPWKYKHRHKHKNSYYKDGEEDTKDDTLKIQRDGK